MRRSFKLLLATGAAFAALASTAYVALLQSEEPEPPVLSAPLRADSIRVGALNRSFVYLAPQIMHRGTPLAQGSAQGSAQDSADESGPRSGRALVIAFHGARGDWRQMRRLTGYALERLAERHGFIVVYPNGVGGHWNDCRAHSTYSAKRAKVDDVAFTRALVRYFRDLYGVDSSRVFALGFSNGGQMAHRLALESPHDIAAIAAAGASLPARDNLDCAPAGVPVPALLIAGTADRVNPYAGGLSKPVGRRNLGRVQSAEATAAYYVRLAGHTRFPLVTRFPDTDPADDSRVDAAVWREAGRAEVQLLTVHGGGHTVPSRAVRFPRILGATNGDMNAADAIWSFFARQMAPHVPDLSEADPSRHREVP